MLVRPEATAEVQVVATLRAEVLASLRVVPEHQPVNSRPRMRTMQWSLLHPTKVKRKLQRDS